MSNKSPTGRRREGRNNFDPSVSPSDVCPYKKPEYCMDFQDGWDEARKDWERRQEEFVGECETTMQNLVDQNQCNHIYGYQIYEDYGDITSDPVHESGLWVDISCDFCPSCGKDLRKEKD